MNKSLLKHYTRALFEESLANDRIREVFDDLCFVVDSLEKETELDSFLYSRQVPLSMKDKVIDEVYQGKIQTMTLGYLHIITKRHLSQFLPIMKEDFRHMLNQKIGVIEGIVYSAYPLEESTVTKLEKVFSGKYDKQVHFRVVHDPRVIAGMKININDTLYDYTIDTKIENIKKKLIHVSD